jgi:diaminohydroxyphosphoribosylaminopyrimidine deaminase / 5-amino-6-(5-phosphoribosylamino)uracil reductase
MSRHSHEADDEKWMRLCLTLASRGRGLVSPNPMVGAVIVRDGIEIGKGYHRRFGGAHAEVNAVLDAERRGSVVEGATLYVSLEPCSHKGKTPPCVDLVIAKKFARVVAATTDPNPLVHGKGVRALRRAGIDCGIGVLRAEAKMLNEAFFASFANGRPLVALKTAQTADGFIARPDGSSKWITNEASRRIVHALRSSYDAILVGAGTVIADDPMLTVRNVKGTSPLRVVLDGNLRLPLDAAVVKTADETGTLVYTAATRDNEKKEKIARLEAKGVIVVSMRADRKRRIRIQDVLADLAGHRIMSVFVEGGADVYAAFLQAGAADVLYKFTSPERFGEGIHGIPEQSSAFRRRLRSHRQIGKDMLDEYTLTFT